jgi:hypothetical protein
MCGRIYDGYALVMCLDKKKKAFYDTCDTCEHGELRFRYRSFWFSFLSLCKTGSINY